MVAGVPPHLEAELVEAIQNPSETNVVGGRRRRPVELVGVCFEHELFDPLKRSVGEHRLERVPLRGLHVDLQDVDDALTGNFKKC